MIRIQKDDFDISAEVANLSAKHADSGGVVTFVGLVRDKTDEGLPIAAMVLEHYPGMAERQFSLFETEVHRLWPALRDTLIVHRVGRLYPGEHIVLVITVALHRYIAFESCQFLIDRIKIDAPFWKREEIIFSESKTISRWVKQKSSELPPSMSRQLSMNTRKI